MNEYLANILTSAKQRFVPFLDWIEELKNPAIVKADLIAGITVALVLIPQSMAYAQLAELPPYIGLYAAFLVPIVAAVFGSSRQLHNGPVAIISLMTAAALIPLELNAPEYIAYAAVLAIMVGIIQTILGFLRLGVLVDFLSHPVIIGFTNSASIVIGSLQLGKLLGINTPSGMPLYETIGYLLSQIPSAHATTTVFGLFSLCSLYAFKFLAPRLPGTVITVILATVISYLAGYEEIGGKVVGDVPDGLPSLVIPDFELSRIKMLVVPAFVIALLSFVEAFSIAKAVASETRQKLSANQEMVGKGFANIVAGLTQSYPVSGSFSRTAVAFSAGAKTGFAAIITGIITGLTLLFFTGMLYHIPLSTLSAVIIFAVFNMIKYQPFKHAWRVNPHDGFVALTVFISTLVFAPHLEKGIFIGVGLSLALYIYRTMTPHFAEIAKTQDGLLKDAKLNKAQTSETFAMYRFDGNLYFANAGYLEKQLLNAIASKPKLKALALDIEAVEHIDATGEEMLTLMSEHLEIAGVTLYILRPKFKVLDTFKRSGLYERIGKHHIFERRSEFFDYLIKHHKDIDISHILEHKPLPDSGQA